MKEKKVKINSIFKTFILAQIHEKPQCGYDLMMGFKELTGKSPSQGTLYPFLHDLVNHNYIVEKLEKDGSKFKKVYHLTKEGEIFVKTIFRSLEFVVAKFIANCAHCGREYYDRGLDDKVIFCCSGCEQDHGST